MSPAVLSLVILGVVIVIVLTDKLPIATVALAGGVACCFLDLYSWPDLFAGLAMPHVAMMMGMFIIGRAMYLSGLSRAISLTILKLCGKSERSVIASIMITATLISTITSNLSCVIMLIPIVQGISREANMSLKKTMYPLALGAGLGGVCSLLGANSNMIANGVLEQFGATTMKLFDIGKVGIPAAILVILFFVTIGMKLLPKTEGGYDGDEIKNEEIVYDKKKMIITGIILALALIAMVVYDDLLMPISICGSILLILTGCITEKEAYGAINMNIFMLFIGFNIIATSISNAGGGTLIAEGVKKVLGNEPNGILICAVIFTSVMILSSFLSNSATVMMMAPIVVMIAQELNMNPTAFVACVLLGANASFATPIGSPAFTLTMPLGHYKFVDYLRMGIPAVIITGLIAVLVGPMVWAF